MKVNTETVKRKIYICEICGKESINKLHIKQCEKSHTCKHEPKFILNEIDDGSWVNSISVECLKCGRNMEDYKELEFSDIEESQEALRRIYSILNEYKE